MSASVPLLPGPLLPAALLPPAILPAALDPASLEPVIAELAALRAEMLTLEEEGLRRAKGLHPAYRQSARNLLHYLALRRRDLRPLQERLALLGLSSLGRSEPHVLANLDAVLAVLHGLVGRAWSLPTPREGVPAFAEGSQLLHRHAEDLLGPPRPDRRVRILVTLPSEAAEDYELVRTLAVEGMDGARINCAHDDEAAWAGMIENLRRADASTGRRTRVLMDLAGPKLRTGPLSPAPEVLKLKPKRDPYGRVVAPAVACLLPPEGLPPPDVPRPSEPVLPVPASLLALLAPGDELRFRDARGARRMLRVTATAPGSARVETSQTAYLVPGLVLEARRGEKTLGEGSVSALEVRPGEIRLRRGDMLEVTRSLEPGLSARVDAHGRVRTPARIGCTLPEIFDQVKAGERIWFDDGRIGGVIRAVRSDRLLVEIVEARPKGERLGADKGINLPDSTLTLAALTAKDLRDLVFVAKHADAVAFSFVSSAADVDLLEEQLRRLGSRDLGIVLKIETRRAFEHLPELLLASMQSPCGGVMIARGDLAVECGWQRLAEVQEQILWLCEAGHVPVIWATQVLEMLAKEGRPSRAEISDAAMGERAECVMLNKGPHLPLAVKALGDILHRMQDHQQKKRSMLRSLHVAGVR